MRKILVSLIVVLLATVMLCTASAAWILPERSTPSFEAGTFGVGFTDGTGSPRIAPFAERITAWPGMAPWRSIVVVENTGSQSARYMVHTARLPTDRGSLAGRLFVTVRHQASSAIAYEGSLDRLRFEGRETMQPGATAAYELTVTWPGAGDDNLFQGRSARFDMCLRAKAEGA